MSTLQNLETDKSYKYLYEVETLAQDLLTAKETKKEIANAQNKFREALRSIEQTEERRTWIQIGSVYVEKPSVDCINLLRSEIAKAEEDLNNLHKEIKEKMYKLRDLEHEPRLEGFTLKPLSLAEAKGLHKAFGC
ncbi:hypothetical protein NQ315_009112 [Exocentrus adspersus]|uniref:P53 and DNA damage-regulated protein 1 n=1 Tax=Exocentrus adspersus TaxID=1586481 RepID=A0AAV8WF75_9CUCU|nr:hypothetical protein NQ315_009112 [Exocentrus adspersus]